MDRNAYTGGVPYADGQDVPGFDHCVTFLRTSPANLTPLVEIGRWLVENEIECWYLEGGALPLRVAFRTPEAAMAFRIRWG